MLFHSKYFTARSVIRKLVPKCRTIFVDVNITDLNHFKIPIRNRNFLPGSSSKNMPDYITTKTNENLKVVQVNQAGDSSGLKAIGEKMREMFDDNIEKTPAILVKGLPLQSSEDFDDLGRIIGYKIMSYESGTAYREKSTKSVYTASDEPAEFTIEPHNGMSYLQKTHSKIMFCCVESAETGGESPVVFNKEVAKKLDPEIVEKLTKRKVRYYRNLPHNKQSDYITWQKTFEISTEEEAETIMKAADISWKWNDDGSLSIWNVLPAVRPHPVSGETIWFNQIQANHCSYYKAHPNYVSKQHLQPHEYHYHCTYGDGQEIEDEIVDHVRSTIWNCAVPLKLERGDVILLDNFLCMHSRMGYTGNRRIFVQLIE